MLAEEQDKVPSPSLAIPLKLTSQGSQPKPLIDDPNEESKHSVAGTKDVKESSRILNLQECFSDTQMRVFADI